MDAIAPAVPLPRAFLILAAAWASAAGAHPPDVTPAVEALYRDEDAAILAGEALGIGTARLEGPATVEVDSYQTLSIVYTAGKAGIAAGGGMRIGMVHAHRWTMPQTNDPEADGYVTVKGAEEVPRVTIEYGGPHGRLFGEHHPWQNVVEVVLPEVGLAPGETLSVTYGARTAGSRGIRVQPFDEKAFAFRVTVDVRGNGEYLPLRNRPAVEIVAAEADRLSVVMPSDATADRPTWCLVRAEDRFGNPATTYRGTVTLGIAGQGTDHSVSLPEAHTFSAEDRGVYRFEDVIFHKLGLTRLDAGDGQRTATGNPVRVVDEAPDRLLLWGDLHGHTLASDGRGTVEAFYDFAERVAGLDFCAVTDHGFLITDAMWEHSKKVTNAAYRPGHFVTFQAYEWSGTTDLGGDHNVFFLDEDPPLLRSRSYYHPGNPRMIHGSESRARHVEDLYSALTNDARRDVLLIPHWGGRKANPGWHRPKLERLIEIFSEHGRNREWAEEFLRRGYRLGIMASTDNHFGNPGHGYLRRVRDWNRQEIGMASVAVEAADRTREAIFEAFFARRVYATTGERILLEMDADGLPMGSVLEPGRPPLLHVRAVGTAPIASLEIWRNGELAFSEEPGGGASAEVELSWRDPRPETLPVPAQAGTQSDYTQSDYTQSYYTQSYYYVRVVQLDGEEAVSSPVWVTGPARLPRDPAGGRR